MTHPSQEAQADLREAEALAGLLADNTSIVGAQRIANSLRALAAELTALRDKVALLRSQQPVSGGERERFEAWASVEMPSIFNTRQQESLWQMDAAWKAWQAARLSAPQAAGWIDVATRLPTSLMDYPVICRDGLRATAYYSDNTKDWTDCNREDINLDVIAWFDVPEYVTPTQGDSNG